MKLAMLIVSLLLCLSMPAFAQTDTASIPEPESVRIMEASAWAGLSLPYLPLDFRENWKSGYSLGVSYGYTLDPGSLGYGAINISAEYARMKLDTAKYAIANALSPSSVVPYSGAVRAFNILINFRGTFAKDSKSIGPYFQVGVGYINVAQNAIAVSPDTTKNIAENSQSAFSWSAGVGIDVPVGEHMVVFAQIKSAIAVVDPVRQYFPLSAGFRYRW